MICMTYPNEVPFHILRPIDDNNVAVQQAFGGGFEAFP